MRSCRVPISRMAMGKVARRADSWSKEATRDRFEQRAARAAHMRKNEGMA